MAAIDPSERQRIAEHLRTTTLSTGDPRRALEHARAWRRAIALLPESNEQARLEIECHQVMLERAAQARCRETFEELQEWGVALGRRHGDRHAWSTILALNGATAEVPAHPEGLLELLQEAQQMAERAGDPELRLPAAFDIGNASRAHRWPATDEIPGSVDDIVVAADAYAWDPAVYRDILRLWLLVERGSFHAAHMRVELVTDRARESRQDPLLLMAWVTRIRLAQLGGDRHVAEDLGWRTFELGRRIGEPGFRIWASWAAGTAALLASDSEEARSRLQACAEQARNHPCGPLVHSQIARSLLAGNDARAAGRAANDAVTIAETFAAPSLIAESLLARAACHRAIGPPEHAVADLERARHLLQDCEAWGLEPILDAEEKLVAVPRCNGG